MNVTVDVRRGEDHSEWVELCKSVANSVSMVDGVRIMTSESHFYFDAVEENGVNVSEAVSDAFSSEGYDDIVVSMTGFSHLDNIADHTNTKEIRATNSVTD